MSAQRVQNIPGIQAAIVPIRENGLDRVVADRLNAQNIDVLLADLQGFLPDAMPARFGRWGENAQELVSQLKTRIVLERQFEQPRFLVQLDFGRNTGVGVKAGHDFFQG